MSIRCNRFAILIAVLSFAAASPVTAMTMTVEGDTAILSGGVIKGDCDQLEHLLDGNRIARVVLKDSGGGNAISGYCIGALIRKRGLSTTIRGRCASSCSRMWLGGVERTLEGATSRVGLHGNYDGSGALEAGAPNRLREWIPSYAPNVDRTLMEKWIHLPVNKSMMYFYNDKAELCQNGTCAPVEGRNVHNAGLATR